MARKILTPVIAFNAVALAGFIMAAIVVPPHLEATARANFLQLDRAGAVNVTALASFNPSYGFTPTAYRTTVPAYIAGPAISAARAASVGGALMAALSIVAGGARRLADEPPRGIVRFLSGWELALSTFALCGFLFLLVAGPMLISVSVAGNYTQLDREQAFNEPVLATLAPVCGFNTDYRYSVPRFITGPAFAAVKASAIAGVIMATVNLASIVAILMRVRRGRNLKKAAWEQMGIALDHREP